MPDSNTNISNYTEIFTKRVETALIDLWGRLGNYRQYLVLVGGLVPRYITAPEATSKHCGTMDIDLGISMAVENIEVYRHIREILSDLGYRNALNARGNIKKHSFVKGEIAIDFLTTSYGHEKDRLIRSVEDEIFAIKTKGIGLAFHSPLKVTIKGTNSNGYLAEEEINICRPFPYIVLKALAYDNRRLDKDVYDLVFVLTHYQEGVVSVVEDALKEDVESQACRDAIKFLKRCFQSMNYNGPGSYETFTGIKGSRAVAYAAVKEFLEQLK
ncbi:MAG: hypothetical protein PHY26_04240 [Bacilli bacterium]|nr:hypothetical protein [Bacilli bacterium]